MNDFSARKVGEVLAFSRVLKATLTRGKNALLRVFDAALLENLESINARLLQSLSSDEPFVSSQEIIMAKAEKTEKKLISMQDLYLTSDEDWDDPAELMEWLGFFEGAALVHWKLVTGAAMTLNNPALIAVAQSGEELHVTFLEEVGRAIQAHGASRAKE